jgi:hypothetical protein
MSTAKKSSRSQLAFPIPIQKINDEAKGHPPKENYPAAGGYLDHQIEAAYHAQHRDQRKFFHEGDYAYSREHHHKKYKQNLFLRIIDNV